MKFRKYVHALEDLKRVKEGRCEQMEEDGERGGNVGMACLRALLSRETPEKRERNI